MKKVLGTLFYGFIIACTIVGMLIAASGQRLTVEQWLAALILVATAAPILGVVISIFGDQ